MTLSRAHTSAKAADVAKIVTNKQSPRNITIPRVVWQYTHITVT